MRQRVYALVVQVPYGRVTSYGALARALGEPRRAREVGWALASTPECVDIPAHRVINSRGQLSGAHAFGGYEVHRAMLAEEGVPFLPDGRVDLAACEWSPPDH